MANNEAAGRPKRRLNDYAGLAALVAAVGAIIFGVIDRLDARDEAERMNRSLFEHAKAVGGSDDTAKVAVLEWRVAQLERLAEQPIEPPPPMPVRRPARAPASFDEGEGEGAAEGADGDALLDELAVGAAQPLNAAADVSFDQIQQTVEAGGVYEAEK